MRSILAFAKTIPVTPPTVNKKMNPRAHHIERSISRNFPLPWRVETHLKILIPVGMAMSIVTLVKYVRVSTSIPILNMWWAHTKNPNKPILAMA